jgi:hypothetical protein
MRSTPDDAGVMGAAVSLTRIDTGRTRETTTDRAGRFAFPLLAPGTYRLEVTRDGFDRATLEPLTLQVNDELAIRVVLRVRGVAETVDVTGQATLVRDTPAVSTSVPRALVDRLPLNGRNLQSLLLLTPGVNLNPTVTQGASGQFSVNGQRPSGNAFIVDGVSANVGVTGSAVPGEGGSGSLPALTVQGGTSSLVSIEALQEFSVQTSTYSAEFGRTPGGQIYGVTSYHVARQTAALGLRVALGARPEAILWMIGGQCARLVSLGLIGGVLLALWLSRFVASILYETSSRDTLAFIAAPALLAAVTLASAYIPARRATRVDPVVALREGSS